MSTIMNRTPMECISDLVLALTIIATEPDAWMRYRVGQEGKDVVVDRIDNNITHYLKEIEKRFDELYNASIPAASTRGREDSST